MNLPLDNSVTVAPEALVKGIFYVTGLHLRSFEEPRMTAETAPSTVAPPGVEAGSKYQYYDPEYARMEAWLDEHPDFVQDYFLRYSDQYLSRDRNGHGNKIITLL